MSYSEAHNNIHATTPALHVARDSSAGIIENSVTVSPSTLGTAGIGGGAQADGGAQAGGGAQTKVDPRIDTVLNVCSSVWESLYSVV